jgi:NADH:ubiquinone oxidoreductase subunit E
MVLRVPGEEILLKVQRELRAELSGRIPRGAVVEVAGVVRTELFTGETKRVVTQVRPLVPVAATQTCTIRICAKKNCWKQGGRELWRAFETEIAGQGLGEAVRLKAVGCLDQCKHAPNIECHGHFYRHCSPAQAPAFLATLVPRPETPG